MRKSIISAVCVGASMMSLPAMAASGKLTVVERATTDVISVHGGTAADNVGDVLTFANEVYDAQNKVKLGSDQGFCTRLVLGKSFECHWTLILAHGQIVVDGPFYDAGDSTMAITGGTGAYSGARGEMRLHSRDAKNTSYEFIYQFKQ